MKFSRVLFLFIALSLMSVANAQTNYLSGLNYSTSVNNSGGPGPTTSGAINSSTSITLTAGSINSSISLPERSGGTQIYTPILSAGNYTFSFNYSGPAANFTSIGSSGCSTGGPGSLPPCPTSGLSLYYRLQGGAANYLGLGNALTIGNNSLVFSLGTSSVSYTHLTLPTTSRV